MRPFDISTVLVRTIYDSNIGASSRAMANMGVEKLILIDPRCEVTYAAQQAAATGQHALQNRKVYSSWQDFFAAEPEGLRISFTARDGRGRQVRDFAEALNWIKDEHPAFQKSEITPIPVYLIFGPEDWGLSADDLELTHFACAIPTFGDNTSLNLAQAVLLALYTLRLEWGGQRSQLEGQQPPRQTGTENVFPEKALQQWLQEMGFDISHRRINVYTVLKRMLLHNIPNSKELRVLETVLQQAIRKLREYNELRRGLNLPNVDVTNKEQNKTPSDK
ncbi:MAG: RNA methyltransferase [Bdellovibrio sp. CG10_big_fil_rev_8_21_14_0_10_47_8]|nr:MAG: RNA methyltransferase [Bdellovibrio sp. CG10_big_fil_rev_8_21_14_0_10_47_8]